MAEARIKLSNAQEALKYLTTLSDKGYESLDNPTKEIIFGLIRANKKFEAYSNRDLLKKDFEQVKGILTQVAADEIAPTTAGEEVREAKTGETKGPEEKEIKEKARVATEKFVAGQKEIYLRQKNAQPIKVGLTEGIKIQEVAKEVQADNDGFVEGFVQKATRLSNIPEGMNEETVQVLAPIAALDLAEKLKEVPSGAILEEITPLPDQAFLLAHLASLRGLSRGDIENLYTAGLGQALRSDLLGKIIEKQYPEVQKVFYSPARQEFEEAQQSDAVATKIDLKETLQRAQALAGPIKLTPNLAPLQRFLTGISGEIFRKPDTFVYSGDAAALSRQQILLQLHPKIGDLAANRLLMWDENKLDVSVPLQQMMPQLGLTIRGEVSLGLGPFSKALKIPGVSAFVQKTTSALTAKLAGTAVGKTAIKFGTWAATRLGVNLIPVVGQILSVLTIAWDAIKFALKKLFNNPELLALLAAPFLLLSFVNPLFLLPGGMFLGSALWVGGTPAVFGGFGLLLRGLGNLFTGAILPGIAGPLIGTLIGLPVLVALILFIINSGAYVVPPGTGFIPGSQQCAPGTGGGGILSQTETTKIMPLGDSITVGVPGETGNTSPGGYRGPLKTQLTDAGYHVDFVGDYTTGPPSEPMASDDEHQAVGGQGTVWVLGGIEDWVARHDPDVILLHIGTNFLESVGIEQNITNVREIVARINNYSQVNRPSKPVKIFLATIIPLGAPHPSADSYKEYNTKIRTLSNLENVVIVDMESEVSVDDLPDDVHPNPAGYKKMAQKWFETLAGGVSGTGEFCIPQGELCLPASGTVIQLAYCDGTNDYTHCTYHLNAYDIGNGFGTPIYAVHAGAAISQIDVDASGNVVGYGNYVDVVGNGIRTRYGHMLYNDVVPPGTQRSVQPGDLIGYMGSSGLSDTPHVHFEVRQPATHIKNLFGLVTERQEVNNCFNK